MPARKNYGPVLALRRHAGPRASVMTIRPIFAWYDMWVGVFVDRPKRRAYLFPIPCIGIVITRTAS